MDAPVLMPHQQPGAFEHPQVLGYGGQGHIVRRGQIANGGFALRQPRQDAPAGGVGKRGKSGVEGRLRMLNHMV
jgi:hypothetical protein